MIPSIFTSTKTTKKGKTETHLRWWVTLIMSLILAIGTWNPTGYHFVHYVSQKDILSGFTPFAILIMVGLWILALKSIFQSLKVFGAVFIVVIILAFLWGLKQYNIVDFDNFNELGWAATLSVGFLIWIGLNASIIWKTLTGVYTTEHVEDEE